MPLSVSPRQQRLAAIAVATCGSLWGLYWIPVHWFETRGIGGSWISLIFSLVAMVAPLPWMLRRGAWRGLGGYAVTGLLLGGGFALYSVSLVLTDVVKAILLFYLTPIWSTIGERLVHGQPLTGPRLVAIVMGLSGVSFILGFSDGFPLPRNTGDWMALASGMVWAMGTMRSYARPAPGVAVPVFTFGLGGLIFSLLFIMAQRSGAHAMLDTGAMVALLPKMVPAALVIFVLPTALVLWAAQRIDSGRVGILLMTEALVGSASAAFLSGEPYGTMEAAGTVLIVGAGLVEVLGRRTGA